MEKINENDLENISGGVGSPRDGKAEVCYLCGKESSYHKDSFNLDFASVFDEKGEHKLCLSCYSKWCDGKTKKL